MRLVLVIWLGQLLVGRKLISSSSMAIPLSMSERFGILMQSFLVGVLWERTRPQDEHARRAMCWDSDHTALARSIEL